MPTVNVTVTCPVHDSFRVQQVAGMFDLPLDEKVTERFQDDVPGVDENWQIGLVVGPSGSGKSTVARRAFAVAPGSAGGWYAGAEWPSDCAVIDCFGELSVRHVVDLFTAVGFGSPPAWVKPYQVLSNGERFRCDLARALAAAFINDCGFGIADCGLDNKQSEIRNRQSEIPRVAFDEFTSVVDRNVAKVCSAAIAKGIRRGSLPCRFVAVTCHYDVAAWLEPDWILDMATCELTRRRLRRPTIELEIRRCRLAAWQLFKRHHYLSSSLARGARCYLTTWDGIPVNFCATVPMFMKKNHRRFTRIVTLPDYQGIGIGMRAVAAVAKLHRAEGLRINVTSSHPALIRHCCRSPLWKAVDVRKWGGSAQRTNRRFPKYRNAAGRTVVSFEFLGERKDIANCVLNSSNPHSEIRNPQSTRTA